MDEMNEPAQNKTRQATEADIGPYDKILEKVAIGVSFGTVAFIVMKVLFL